MKRYLFDTGSAADYMNRRGGTYPRAMQQIDIQLAAIARCLSDCTISSKDTDLCDVPGLTAENWA